MRSVGKIAADRNRVVKGFGVIDGAHLTLARLEAYLAGGMA